MNSRKGLLNFPVTCNHTEIDECSTNPCQNGGSCLDGGGWHVCLCQEGFTGKDCEKCERNLIKSFQMKIHYQYYTWISYHHILEASGDLPHLLKFAILLQPCIHETFPFYLVKC